ncbi:hypothetical protein CONPUDRAFT_149403 [Coniophora puteana RWD-64-598 SS2]|uniref:Cyclin N-terminal domain-containing protein n=1 Tax=Coniophora puteana (strain RWD-64-598) TaxID=741705 RepID=A0A5M3N7F2_CONPW|nr:uncharacterized protein CONPUDRAFT_149403 [Coniophora puteana RWD-64-598 SS2]EIW87372.1 hypothetical protein CONPUDRAFT_149403 [Coniophora puteana RWD-64-598 SS2]
MSTRTRRAFARGSSLTSSPARSTRIRRRAPVKLPYFIAHALHRTKLHACVTFAALALLQRLKARFSTARGSSGHRLFVSTSLIASKSMFQLREINQMECKMCQYLDWELNVDPITLQEFEARIRKDFAGPGPYPTYILPSPSKATPSPPSTVFPSSTPTPVLTSSTCAPITTTSGPSRAPTCSLAFASRHPLPFVFDDIVPYLDSISLVTPTRWLSPSTLTTPTPSPYPPLPYPLPPKPVLSACAGATLVARFDRSKDGPDPSSHVQGSPTHCSPDSERGLSCRGLAGNRRQIGHTEASREAPEGLSLRKTQKWQGAGD